MEHTQTSVRSRRWLVALLLSSLVAGCGGGGGGGGSGEGVASNVTADPGMTVPPGAVGVGGGTATDPTVKSTNPDNNAVNISTSNTAVTAIFTQPMDAATLASATAGAMTTFSLKDGSGVDVPGTVALSNTNTVAVFTASSTALAANTQYTATVTVAAKSAGGTAMANPVEWRFTTRAAGVAGLLPVDLRTAGTFAILAKSGISTVPGSAITGDIGVSPIAASAITGFSETRDGSNTFSTSPQVTGKIYAADYTTPTPEKMTTAVSDMETAYADAAGRVLPNATELGAGEIGGLTLSPGLYKWSTGVNISTSVTLSGSATDVWIFQIAGDITQASATRVNLIGGAMAKNVFWQVSGGTGVEIGTTAHFEGTILAIKAINLRTGATANSRLLAQTGVVLQQNSVTQPAQ